MRKFKVLVWVETEVEDELNPMKTVIVRSHETIRVESQNLGEIFAAIRHSVPLLTGETNETQG